VAKSSDLFTAHPGPLLASGARGSWTKLLAIGIKPAATTVAGNSSILKRIISASSLKFQKIWGNCHRIPAFLQKIGCIINLRKVIFFYQGGEKW
jgi:hypothetical protein